MLDSMIQQNASKYAIFFKYKNPCRFFRFFIYYSSFFTFLLFLQSEIMQRNLSTFFRIRQCHFSKSVRHYRISILKHSKLKYLYMPIFVLYPQKKNNLKSTTWKNGGRRGKNLLAFFIGLSHWVFGT